MAGPWAGEACAALGGPDFQAIEQARKAKQKSQVERVLGAGAMKCPPGDLVLPVAHGPRAQTTPYQNRLRQERHEAQVRACREAGSEPNAGTVWQPGDQNTVKTTRALARIVCRLLIGVLVSVSGGQDMAMSADGTDPGPSSLCLA